MDFWASSPLKYGPAKIERKRVKKLIFMYNMHGMDVAKYAKMNNYHTPIPSFCSSPSKKKEKENPN